MSERLHIKLRVWRQKSPEQPGAFVEYDVPDISPSASFLEMLDVVNGRLEAQGQEPIAFSHDCREGICGSCGCVVDGVPHGPMRGIATCQLYMRQFESGDTITVEPWRARAFPVIKDLVVDRSGLDRIVASGGYVSVNTGSAPDGNTIPIGKEIAEQAMDAAACIGCGACVAACKNASAMLFTSAKAIQLNLLPQGQPERHKRILEMVQAHDDAGFGACSQTGACEAACPKEISMNHIAQLNWDYLKARIFYRKRA